MPTYMDACARVCMHAGVYARECIRAQVYLTCTCLTLFQVNTQSSAGKEGWFGSLSRNNIFPLDQPSLARML